MRSPSAARPDRSSEALDVGSEHHRRQEPPGGDAGLYQPPGGDQTERDQGGDGPVVAEDVVNQEQDDRFGPPPHDHQAAPAADATSPSLRPATPSRQRDTMRMSARAAAT